MLVEKDHGGGDGSCWFCKMMRNAEMSFLHQKFQLFHKLAPRASVRNINCSKLYVSSASLLTNVPRSKIQVDVEIIGKLRFVRVLLHLFPQQYYYYYYYYYYYHYYYYYYYYNCYYCYYYYYYCYYRYYCYC